MPDSTEKGVNVTINFVVTINFATKNRKETKIMTNELFDNLTRINSLSQSRKIIAQKERELGDHLTDETLPISNAYFDGMRAIEKEIDALESETINAIMDAVSPKINNALRSIGDDFVKGYDMRMTVRPKYEKEVKQCARRIAVQIVDDFEQPEYE